MARELLARVNSTVTPRSTATEKHLNRAMQPATAQRSPGAFRQGSKRLRTSSRASTIEGAFTASFCPPRRSAPYETTKNTELFSPTLVQQLIPINSVAAPLADRPAERSDPQRRTRRRATVIKPLTYRTAIARSAPSSSRIVVISPEEARRARENAAQATPKPRFTRVIPSSGRLAFEALFSDGADLSSSS
jgi:hypothetical protein